MKKLLLRIVIGLIVLIVLAVLAVGLFLDGAVKRGVETIGPKVAKVSVKLDSVKLSLLSGSGTIKGFVLGNPEGFKSPQALSVGSATIALKPGSLLSDKVIINKIEMIAPEITFEGGLGGNNLSKILANLNETTGGEGQAPTQPKEAQAGKKLQVDDFTITGAKVHVSLTDLNKSGVVSIPDIRLTQLGTGPEGITAAELSKEVLQKIEKAAAEAVAGGVANLGGLTNLTQGLGTNAAGAASKIGKSVGDLLKKK